MSLDKSAKGSESVTEYPDYVHELAEAQAHVERLLSALKGLYNSDGEMGPSRRVAIKRAEEAIAKAEAWA